VEILKSQTTKEIIEYHSKKHMSTESKDLRKFPIIYFFWEYKNKILESQNI
jgi:hypothetical protein